MAFNFFTAKEFTPISPMCTAPWNFWGRIRQDRRSGSLYPVPLFTCRW